MRQKFFPNFCDENRAVCENIWKKQTGYRRQYKTGHAQCMLCNKGTDTHSEFVILIYCFSTVKCLCKRASILLLYLYCLFCLLKWLII